MVDKRYIPERGDIVWTRLEHASGHIQSGKRPLLVLSHRAYNGRSGLVLMCPITSAVKGYPAEVAVEGKKTKGVVLSDQVRAFDWMSRKLDYKESVSQSVVDQVVKKLEVLIK